MKNYKIGRKSFILLSSAVFFVLLSIVLAISTVIRYYEHNSIRDNLVTVEGVVSEVFQRPVSFNNKTGNANKVDYMYYVTYKYKNRVYQDVYWKYDSQKTNKSGDIVEITIDPASPDRIYSYSGENIWIFWTACSFLCGAVLFLIFTIRSKQNILG